MMFPDKRVRQAAARWAASLPEEEWDRDVANRIPDTLEYELTRALAAHWRRPAESSDEEVRSAAALVVACRNVNRRLVWTAAAARCWRSATGA